MKCYRCNCRLSPDRNVCPKCGADVRLYRKIIYTSNQYYNLGLARAKARDLTGAAECLRTSLQLYKRNINARNLLGLVYYEMGEAALALKEWVISKNFRHRGNIADTYIQDMRDNRQALDSADHSVRRFNQALEYAKTGSRDLAVIQLKKVIAVNPRMLKAYLLLALLYMEDQKYDQARAVVKKCLEIDRGNPQAMSWMRELSKYRSNTKENIGVAGELEREEVIIPVRMRDYGSYLSCAMYILLGFVLSLGILYYVIMPAKEQQYQNENLAQIQEYENRCTQLNGEISDLNSQIEKLQDDKDAISKDFSDSSEEAGALQAAYASLLEMTKLYISGDYMSFADQFPEVDASASGDATYQEVYTLMKEDYDTNLTNRLYQMAVDLREIQNRREDAITVCDKILSIDPNYDTALFYKALCYEEIGDRSTAAGLYIQYLTEFASGSWVEETRNRLQAFAPDVLMQFDNPAPQTETPVQEPVQAPAEQQAPAEDVPSSDDAQAEAPQA